MSSRQATPNGGMSREAIIREAKRNVTSGTSKPVLLVVLLLTLTLGIFWFDQAAVNSIENQATVFKASGANVVLISTTGEVDGQRCENLKSLPNVLAAGATRQVSASYALTMPGSSIPTFEVTTGFADVLNATNSGTSSTGVIASADLQTALGVAPGDQVKFTNGTTELLGSYAWPQDGRLSGYGYAMMEPVTASGAFDTCWVREWPVSDETLTLLRTTLIGSAGSDPNDKITVQQLNSSLGRNIDVSGMYDSRLSRWMVMIGFVVAALLTFGLGFLRRLEYSYAQHLGVRKIDALMILLTEQVMMILPVVTLALVCSLVVGLTTPDRFWSTFASGTVSAVGVALGALSGAMLFGSTIKQSRFIKYAQRD